jgi:hypothetical protein
MILINSIKLNSKILVIPLEMEELFIENTNLFFEKYIFSKKQNHSII